MSAPTVMIRGAWAGVGRLSLRRTQRARVRASACCRAAVLAVWARCVTSNRAASALETAFGPIHVWINNATVFSPVAFTTPAEFRRLTEVTYLGVVHGTLAAPIACCRATAGPTYRSDPRSPIEAFHCRRILCGQARRAGILRFAARRAAPRR
jgi:NAD(P)-dependent dehydrogenase (short-subunit alcohol dehydrogenase family)